MPPSVNVQSLTDRLHLSHSQIFTYLNCNLKYKFRYVLSLPAERISLALPFGSAMHKAMEFFYRRIGEEK